MPNSRSQWVDVAKGIGIILVVYGHVARGLVAAHLMADGDVFRTIDSVIYSFHMPLFFFLSGLFFCESLAKRGKGRLILNKVDTIVYPYIVWSLIQGLIEVFLSRYTNGNLRMADVYALLWQPRAQFWFLYALFLIFVIFSLIQIRRTPYFVVALCTFCAALFLGRTYIAFGNSLDLFGANAVFFAAGIVFERFALTPIARRPSVLFLLGMLFLSFQYCFHRVLDRTYADFGWASLLLSLTSILFIASLSLHLERLRPRPLLALGAASMAIYLMHILFSSGARTLAQRFVPNDATSIYLVLGMTAGLAIPLIVFNLAGSTPLNALFTIPGRYSIEALVSRGAQRTRAASDSSEVAVADSRFL